MILSFLFSFLGHMINLLHIEPISCTTVEEMMSNVSEFLVPKENPRRGKKGQEEEEGRELSTEEIMRVASAHFIQLSGDPSMDPFGLCLSALTPEEKRRVDLATLLLSTAECVSNRQYDQARILLSTCREHSSITGNPVQRVVYHFSAALQERIDRETGKISPRDRIPAYHVIDTMLVEDPVKLLAYNQLPFSQLLQFTSIQSIIDSVTSARRIHMIDLSFIKHGLHWVILMQALATRSTCPIDYLKITAIGASEDAMATTGKNLVNFAKSLALTLKFKTVAVSDITCFINEGMIDADKDEALGVYCSFSMNTMVVKPERLEKLMLVLQKLNPCILTVADFEADHNSPCFANRFTEALFYYSAFFDCINALMDRNGSGLMVYERCFCAEEIRRIVASEGSDRLSRSVGLKVWRSFFARFGFIEAELNEWSQYQASMLIEKFARGSPCTVDMDGKSMMVGWRGQPLFFVSAWKLQRTR